MIARSFLQRIAVCLLFAPALVVRADEPARKPPAGFEIANHISEAVRVASEKVKPAVVTLDIPKNRVSGFFVDPNGLILTAAKPVKDLKEVTIWLEGNRKKSQQGTVIAIDLDNDLAIVKVDGEKFPYVRFGESAGLPIGTWLIAIGEQRGMTQSVSTGIVSGPMRRSKRMDGPLLLQTQVPTDGGNLGGPLVDLNGDVVGIVSQIPSKRGEFGPPPKGKSENTFGSPAFEGLTFAIPGSHLKEVVPKLVKDVKLAAAGKARPSAEAKTANQVGDGIRWIAEQVMPAVVSMRSTTTGGLCSGVLIDPTGHVLTHHAVVDKADVVKVVHEGKVYEGKVVAADKSIALAVVKIEGKDFPFARLGDSSAAQTSDWVVAIGAPFDWVNSVGLGVIGKPHRMRDKIDMLQTNAPLHPNNTGGPLINDRGEVIGIMAANMSSFFRGLAFAVPIATAKEQLLPKLANLEIPTRRGERPASAESVRQLGEAFRWAADQVRPAVVWTGGGCGVIVSPDGYIVTNNHVIGSAKALKVTMPGDKTPYTAKVVGRAPRDIGLLKIERTDGKDFPHARMGDSDLMRVGDWIMSIGGPLVLTDTVTEGTISGKDRGWPAKKLQHDSPINPGNSGGVLVNLLGEVIAMNGTTEGTYVSYGTPINYVKQIMDEMRNGAVPGRGQVGLQLKDVNDEIARDNKLMEPKGAAVVSIVADSPAEKAELKPGDVVTHFNGFAVRDTAELGYVISLARPGTTATMSIVRQGQPMRIEVTIGERSKS